MRFEAIGEVATVTFDMDGLEAMARICKAAVETGEQGIVAEMALAAFTTAALIARAHGDMPEAMKANMERTCERVSRGA